MATITSQMAAMLIPALTATTAGTEEAKLPDLKFRNDLADFSHAYNCLDSKIEISIPGEISVGSADARQWIMSQTIEEYDKLKRCPECEHAFVPLNSIASNLGERIANIFQLLKTSVYPEVESLKQSINEKIEDILREQHYNVALLKEPKLATAFDKFDFEDFYQTMGGKDFIVDEYSALVGFTPTYTLQDISAGVSLANLQVKTITLPAETIDDCVKRIQNTRDTDNFTLNRAFGAVTDNFTAGFLFAPLRQAMSSNDFSAILKELKNCLDVYVPVIEAIKRTSFNLPDSTIDIIHENIETLKRAFTLMRYAVVVFDNIFHDAVAIDAQTLRADTYATYAEKGGTEEDIAQFIFVFYTSKQIPVPNNGITADELFDAKSQVTEEFAAINAKFELQENTIRRGVLVQAARIVLMDYLENADQSAKDEGKNLSTYVQENKWAVQKCLNALDNTNDYNLENSLFTFIIDLRHENTLLKTAHDMFGQEVIGCLKINNNIDNSQIALIDARVAAYLAAGFIIENMCGK